MMKSMDRAGKELFSEQVDQQEKRKLQAQQHKRSVWSGMGMFGLIGWSVAVPTITGAGLGIWLDHHYPQAFSWTLSLMIMGLCAGCLIAWRWIVKEHQEMNNRNENDT